MLSLSILVGCAKTSNSYTNKEFNLSFALPGGFELNKSKPQPSLLFLEIWGKNQNKSSDLPIGGFSVQQSSKIAKIDKFKSSKNNKKIVLTDKIAEKNNIKWNIIKVKNSSSSENIYTLIINEKNNLTHSLTLSNSNIDENQIINIQNKFIESFNFLE